MGVDCSSIKRHHPRYHQKMDELGTSPSREKTGYSVETMSSWLRTKVGGFFLKAYRSSSRHKAAFFSTSLKCQLGPDNNDRIRVSARRAGQSSQGKKWEKFELPSLGCCSHDPTLGKRKKTNGRQSMDSVVQKGLYSARFQRNWNQKKDRTGWRAHTRRSVLLKIKNRHLEYFKGHWCQIRDITQKETGWRETRESAELVRLDRVSSVG